ncbi:MAG: ketoacyl-ACP synthase III [bacterium]|nr:ketoacyl-ACP synthase III [bacterium]
MNSMHSVIVGSGSFIPTKKIYSSDFLNSEFYDSNGSRIEKENSEIIEKFEEITKITIRRYVDKDKVASDIACFAAENALKTSGIDRESLDYIIVAHNFGDIKYGNTRTEIVPSLASRVKHKLGIKNHNTIPYDMIFGCPGWLQGMIQADHYIKLGLAKRVMVIGAETISRISDPHDRDSMIYADGAGATIVEAHESKEPVGIISSVTRSDTYESYNLLWMGESFNENYKDNSLFLKMNGHKLYQYALKTVPKVLKESIEKADISITDIKKVLIHQANVKMDEAILKRLLKMYKINEIQEDLMPMILPWIGNSSVATIPTLYDLLIKGKLCDYKYVPESGDHILFASVGAGLNINSVIYKFP